MSEQVKIKQENEQGEVEEMEVSLADIAGIDMNAVEAFEGGFESTPKGVYLFECKDAKLDSMETKNGTSAVIQFVLEIADCYAVVSDDPKVTEESMKGKKHTETIFVSDVAKSVGQAKAIMQNAGYNAAGSLEDLLDGFCGSQFIAPIKHRKDPNDSDKIYANLVIKKITPPKSGEAAA